MKKYGIIAVIFVGVTLAASLAGGYAVNAITNATTESQGKANCSDQLGQAMDDMHQQMHMGEGFRQC
jgi:hypothetical protein